MEKLTKQNIVTNPQLPVAQLQQAPPEFGLYFCFEIFVGFWCHSRFSVFTHPRSRPEDFLFVCFRVNFDCIERAHTLIVWFWQVSTLVYHSPRQDGQPFSPLPCQPSPHPSPQRPRASHRCVLPVTELQVSDVTWLLCRNVFEVHHCCVIHVAIVAFSYWDRFLLYYDLFTHSEFHYE